MKVPILFVTFIKLDTALQVLESIRQYQPKKLYISSDCGRENRIMQNTQLTEKEWVEQVRATILKQIDWECEVQTLFFTENQGCKNGVSSAISWFFEHEEMGIILEDDTLPNQSFFLFCEELLEKYKNTQTIFMISGWSALDFNQEVKNTLLEDYFFSHHIHIWGWASWKRAWQHYQKVFINFKQEFSQLDFDDQQEKKEWYSIFKKYDKGKIDTWDYPWVYTIWKHGGLSVYPKNNMVKNIGLNRADATHTTGESKYERMKIYELKGNIQHPEKIQRNIHLDNAVYKIVTTKIQIAQRIKKAIKHLDSPLLFCFVAKIINLITRYFCNGIKIQKGTLISKRARITGWRNVAIGHHSIIAEYAWLNVNTRNHNAISIGNYCYLGPNTFLSSGQQIVIKDYAMLVVGSKILGANHITDDPTYPYIATSVTNYQKTVIGYNVWIGADAKIVGNVTIGYGSIIGAGSIVTKDIPPFSIVVGNPARIIKRFDFCKNIWVEIQHYDDKKNQDLIPNEEEYLKILQSRRISMPYLAVGREVGDIP